MSTKYCTIDDAYEKNKELKKEDIILLQEWIDKQPHLPKFSEMKLITFLHACYYKIEATKTCIDNFATLRAHWPEFALRRNFFSDDMQQAFHVLLATVLVLPARPNYMIVYGQLFDKNPDVFHCNNFLKGLDMIMSMWIRILGACEGHMIIMDTEGLSFGHILKLNVMGLKKFMYFIQEAAPWRLKGIHVINVSPAFHKLFSILKPFIKEDLMKVIYIHTKMDTLYDDIPKVSLPKDLGGEHGSFQELHDKQMELLKENVEFSIEEEKEIADESKRQEKSKFYEDNFGIEGTFKKLDID